MTTDTSWLKKYVPEFPELKEHVGASGYFSQPAMILDPQLFEGTVLKPYVREGILDLFYSYMSTRYHNVHDWTRVWIAGSGISYQWAADRGNGDLDVLFGIDYTGFVNSNLQFSSLERFDIAYIINDDLRTNLWPKTSMVRFNRGDERAYEVTFYLNYETEDYEGAIKEIHPYAAYDLTANSWLIQPENNPVQDVPKEYEDQAKRNRLATEELVQYYNSHRAALASAAPHSPRWHDALRGLRVAAGEARAMFDQIHTNRKQAFSAQGEGYHDFYNYQWQAAKRDGIVAKLNQIIQAADTEQEYKDMQLYGTRIETDPRRLANAALFSQNR